MRLLLVTVIALAIVPLANSKPNGNYIQAKRLVYQVFPDDTQALMFKVLSCETGYKFNANAKNSSGATGYFQILSSHDGTTYSYNGISITVDSRRLTDPLYNVMVAYLMSRGGTVLNPWYPSANCWG